MAVTIPSFTKAGLPSSPLAGDLARVTDTVQGVWLADGTTAASWFSILGEVVNVKDFGAVGNGVANDSTAIGNAITAATGVVYFPPGNYLCHSAITLKAGVTLVGAGYLASKLTFDSATQGLVYAPGGLTEANIAILNLSIFGVLGTTQSLIALTNAQFVTLANLSVRNTVNDCIALTGCRSVSIRQSRIGSAAQKGVRLTSISNVWAIEGCSFQSDANPGQSGVYVDSSGWGTVRNCEIEGSGSVQHAVELKSCTCISLETNFMEGFTGSVVDFIGPGICTNIRIVGNHLNSTTVSVALVNGGSTVAHAGTLVEGNRFVGASGATCFSPGSSASSFVYSLNSHDPTPPVVDVSGAISATTTRLA